jgi:predicted secreted protein
MAHPGGLAPPQERQSKVVLVTPLVCTVVATVFYNTSEEQSTLYLGLSSLPKLNLSSEHY